MARMKTLLTAAAALLLLAGCSSHGNIADNAAAPPLNVISETPGGWGSLAGMVGRTPADSGLFQNSAINVDLDALLGAEAEKYKLAASAGTPLTREGPVLVTIANDRSTFLTILPGDHALQAGLKQNGRWRLWTTPAASVPQPPAVKALVNGQMPSRPDAPISPGRS